MKVITWNINSFRKRFAQVDRLLSVEEPDVLMLQELRVDENNFLKLKEKLTNENYFVYFKASGGRNGVAIFSKTKMELISSSDRLLGVTNNDLTFWCCYTPSGYSESASVKHKIDFLNNLCEISPIKTIIGGDFNVCYKKNELTMLNPYTTPEINAFKRLEKKFFCTAPEGEFLTWWGYKENLFFRNIGMALDKILISPDLTHENTSVIKSYRLIPSPSDHAPVITNIKLFTL